MLSLGQNWSLHRAWLKAQRLCPIRLISIIADHATQSKQSIRLPSIATLATEIAANFGSTKWTTSFFGSPEIIPWFFRYLIIGTWDGGSPFADFPENQFPVDTVSPTPTVPAFPALGTGVPVDSIFFLPIGVRYYPFCSCFRDHQWHSCKPATGSCSGTSEFGILASYWFWCFWGSFIDLRETAMLLVSSNKDKKTLLGRVGVCVWNIWIDVKLLSLYTVSRCRGAVHDWQTLPNEDIVSSWWYGIWLTRPANHFFSTGNGKRPSQEPQSWILFQHGCRASFPTLSARYFLTDMANGEGIFFLFWGLCGPASVRDLVYLELYGQVSVHDFNYWNFTLKVAYCHMEIYLTWFIWCNCTFTGFSSQRITPMIQFCSSVYVSV